MSADGTQVNPIAQLEPRYVNALTHSYEVTILVGLDTPTVAELRAACDYLQRETASREVTFAPQIGDDGYELRGHYSGYNGLTDDGRKQLEALVQPQYIASGAATADVRRKDDRHIATIVRVNVLNGKAHPVSIEQIEAIDGVRRANWLGRNTRVSFSLVDPTGENVQKVTMAVAELLGLYIPQPVAVNDPNPDAALLPENDFKPLVVSAA